MKYFIIVFSLIFTFNLANGQTRIKPKSKFSVKQVEPDKETEALKTLVNAPVQGDFKSEQEYLKAKAKWVKNNQKSYQRIIGLKEEKVSQSE